ncbi:MAG: hypothetical protein HYR90_01545 [Candidatus Andersenbacteria bacterium]|nr:hypothetical protein [Candidatus Andersenbacteria bacterium]MBI3250842.1 hypothetical protein [Candidatus Andersenbacteria bacterium]
MSKTRKIFFVMAGGGHETDQHYHDTIKNRRSLDEIEKFINPEETEQLRNYAHGRSYAAWGAVPGTNNIRNWEVMEPGDYVMVYRKGKIILAAEIALKVRNENLAHHFWQKDENGKTWEYMYFMTNDVALNVSMSRLNKYLGYEENYHPQGFMAMKQDRVDRLLSVYGDLVSLLEKLEKGEELEEIEFERKKIVSEIIEEKTAKAPTEHTEMQWRLIRLGIMSSFDVWVPAGDQAREFDGHKFRDHVMKEFQETIDVPTYIKNIDTVWKLGHSIKSAFEIEHSTSIYSGILRLSDLRTLTPNSTYPLFIVASRERKSKVFEQLRRPTFASSYLSLDQAVKYLSYDAVRKLDNEHKEKQTQFDIDWLTKEAESVV